MKKAESKTFIDPFSVVKLVPAPRLSWAVDWRYSPVIPKTCLWEHFDLRPLVWAQPRYSTSTRPSDCPAASPASQDILTCLHTPLGPQVLCVGTPIARTPGAQQQCITPTWPLPGWGCLLDILSYWRLIRLPASGHPGQLDLYLLLLRFLLQQCQLLPH